MRVEPLADAASGSQFSPAQQVTVRLMQAADEAAWDQYVEQHPEATFFHKAGWQHVLKCAFGHRSHYLLAEKAGAIVGVLPLGEVKSLMFGHALISTPFCVYGGVVADNNTIAEQLELEACQLAESLGVDYLELRNLKPRNPGWPSKAMYFRFRKAMEDDQDKNLAAIPRKQRAVVRKGIKSDLVSEIESELDDFYLAYSSSVRNLGTPVFSKRYFKVLCEVFGEDVEVLSIKHQGDTVSSVLSFYFRDEVLPYYGGGSTQARALKSNDFMYWELMRRCTGKGIRYFDYGRSKDGSGSFSFKKNWGFIPEPLHYEYYLVKAKAMPEINPNNPKYSTFINWWRKLPLPIANTLGPLISRNLG